MTNTIFITGSSTGLGKATAKYFASNGWNVIATMRSPEKETELNQAANILVLKMDVTDSKSISAAIKSGMERFGSIDVVVNNAGIGRYGALELVEDSAIDTTWDTNIKGVINVIRGILPHFRSAKHGKIINVGSVVGLAAAMPLA